MKLRKIEVVGFKSFRNKAGIEIGDGITAIVGPNGCGKSNIVDAIRWAMGTQSARQLRGNSMTDVIFAGSRRHKPSGLAQVLLTFDNPEPRRPSADEVIESPLKSLVEASATLTVGRRLYRAGEGAYLVNSQQVRLKDIHEIFLGTGASTRGYSIIAQGQIEFMVNARASERRTFVEELAGVTRYRFHRQETQRKLDSTRKNLNRLGDLLSEVTRAIAQLKEQATTALRHVELSGRKHRLEVYLKLNGRRRQLKLLDHRREQLDRGLLARDESQTHLAQAESDERTLTVDVRDCESACREITEEVYSLRARRDLLRQAADHAQAEAERLRQEHQHAVEDGDETALEIEELQTREALLITECQGDPEYSEVPLEITAKVERSRNTLTAVVQQLADLENHRLTASQHAARELARLDGLGDELSRVHEQQRERIARNLLVDAQTTADAERCATVTAAIRDRQRDEDDLDSQIETLKRRLAETNQRRERLRTEIGDAKVHRSSILAKGEAILSTLALDGPRAKHVENTQQPHQLPGVLGVVGDGLLVPEALEAAVQGVLRDLPDYLVVENPGTASAVLALAADRGLVVGCVEQRAFTAPPELDDSLLDHVQVAEWVPRVICYILGSTRLNIALDHLTVRARRGTAGVGLWVDADGNCASAHGFWKNRDPEGGAAVRRARLLAEVDTLEIATAETGVLLNQLQRSLDSSTESCVSAQSQLAEIRAERREGTEFIESAKRELAGITARAEARDAHRKLDSDQDTLSERRRAELDERIRLVELQCQRQRSSADRQNLEIERLRSEREQLQQVLRLAEKSLHSHRAEIDARRRQRRTLKDELGRVGTRLDRARGRLVRTHERARAVSLKREYCSTEADDNRERQAKTEVDVQIAVSDQQRAEKRLESLASHLSQRVDTARQLREQQARLAAKVGRLRGEVELTEREIERFVELLNEQHSLSVDAAEDLLDGFQPPKDPQVALGNYASALDRLGPVNHAATEDLEEAESRHGFLCEQQGDLNSAIEDLTLTIDELDRASKQAFMETFVLVRAEFEKLFRRLFRGGEATMELTDTNDPLSAGVEVIVRPPGKRVRSMTLLSGGEKALTAVALVFAAFRLKPSPFCVLDEVDAPLDDANVEQFVDLIRELSADTQFLVVTHNRRTMEHADKLVGVTMEEPGCSKLMAVDIWTPEISATG